MPVPIGNNEISLRFPRINERRPDPRYTTNLVVSNENYSNYNAFQLEYQKRFTRDFSGQLTAIKAKNPDVLWVPGYYTQAGVIVRKLMKYPGLDDALRISIGTADENNAVLAALAADREVA